MKFIKNKINTQIDSKLLSQTEDHKENPPHRKPFSILVFVAF